MRHWDKLNLLTPILTSISLFILSAVWNDIGSLSESVSDLKARTAALEAQVKMMLREP